MANHTIQNPVGLAAVIQKVQTPVFTRLNTKWGLNTPQKELEGYGKAYVNVKHGKTIPEAFVKDKEYTGTLLTSDRSKFFFIPSGKAKPAGISQWRQDVDLCFILKQSDVKPDLAHRGDSEVHADVEAVLSDLSYLGIAIVGFADKIKNVFEGMDYDVNINMQPNHVFKFTISMLYSMGQKC